MTAIICHCLQPGFVVDPVPEQVKETWLLSALRGGGRQLHVAGAGCLLVLEGLDPKRDASTSSRCLWVRAEDAAQA